MPFGGLVSAALPLTVGTVCSGRGGTGFHDNKSWSLWVEDKGNVRFKRFTWKELKIVIFYFLLCGGWGWGVKLITLNIFCGCLMNFLFFLRKLTISPLVFFYLLRYSSLFRKQFRLSSRRQSSTLAKIPSGPHRDGRPQRRSFTSPPQRPLQHTDPPAQSQLEPLPSFKSFQLPLPTPRLSDSLQTP